MGACEPSYERAKHLVENALLCDDFEKVFREIGELLISGGHVRCERQRSIVRCAAFMVKVAVAAPTRFAVSVALFAGSSLILGLRRLMPSLEHVTFKVPTAGGRRYAETIVRLAEYSERPAERLAHLASVNVSSAITDYMTRIASGLREYGTGLTHRRSRTNSQLCPQPAEEDMRALALRSDFDPRADIWLAHWRARHAACFSSGHRQWCPLRR